MAFPEEVTFQCVQAKWRWNFLLTATGSDRRGQSGMWQDSVQVFRALLSPRSRCGCGEPQEEDLQRNGGRLGQGSQEADPEMHVSEQQKDHQGALGIHTGEGVGEEEGWVGVQVP